MKTELIIVGTELLLGQIVNTNGAFLSKELADLGYEVYFETTVGDNKKRVLETLSLASKRSELIILCGGLGPTTDDLTKEAVSEYIGEPLEYDNDALKKIYHLFSSTDKIMPENNKQQALTFKKGITLQNPTGLACGIFIEVSGVYYLLLPGPPSELTEMFKQEAIPLLKKLNPQHKELVSRYLRFIDIGESQLVTDLSQLIDEQTNPTIAPYAKSNEVMLRLTAQSSDKKTAHHLLDEMEEKILAIEKEYFYGYGEDLTIQDVAITQLMKKEKTLSVIDLLTDGQFYTRGMEVSGANQALKVSLSINDKDNINSLLGTNFNTSTIDLLGDGLANYGLNRYSTDYVMVIIGDVEKGNDDLPEGIVWFFLGTKDGVLNKRRIFKRHTDYIKDGAIKHGYNFLRKNS
ncbi:CinA family nicotinamide mononucleotide deamidase-related protein [Vagococcus sp. JNUCC 83]